MFAISNNHTSRTMEHNGLCAKLSIITPIYGVEKYIEKCVRSQFEQTLKDVEFIYVDDCTKDKSIDILNNLISEYQIEEAKVKILHHEKNQGVTITRHTGLLEATGEYVLYCDSDDWLEPDMCKSLYDEAVRSNADIVYCDYYLHKQNNEILVNERLTDLHCRVHLWNHLVRRSLYMKDILFPVGSSAEDITLMIQLYYYALKVEKVNKPLYHYRLNNMSITGCKTEEACEFKCIQVQRNVAIIEKFLKREGVEQEYKLDIMYMKFVAKSQLTPLIAKKKYRRRWRELYSEINMPILFSEFGLKFKVLFLMRLIGISYQKYGC